MKTNGHLPHVVCIGGGTGTFVVLKGIKHHPCTLSAVVSMSDSGGSNKRIRDEFGLLPTSDIRQCLVALSDEKNGKGLLRSLFMYRFEKGEGISGMTFGNLFMAALSDILGSQEEAIRQTGKVLRIHGSVIPVSFTKTNLTATYENGTTVNEEHVIDEPKHDGSLKITNIALEPKAAANPEAVEAIQSADLIVLGPGDLYTSVLPNLLVNGIVDAIQKSKATVVYIMNLMTKYGQTYNYSATDHVLVLEKYLGKRMNAIIINNRELPQEALSMYAKYHELPVVDDLTSVEKDHIIIRADVVSSVVLAKSSSDNLVRSLIRHDSDKLANVLVSILEKHT
ncbi:MAG: gluconeogenesis factor YvcK family protein [Candidatus Gottesmanbacteria bacterium]